MKTIYIVDILNIIEPYQLVRCFEYKGKIYLIYTKNQRIKENNNYYVKNYVAVKNSDEMWVEPTITEWKEFQIIIKKIANESSLGSVSTIDDIPIDDRESFIVITNRLFKVIPFYHHLISSNFNTHIPNTLHLINSNNQLEDKFHPKNIQYQYEIGSIAEPKIDYVTEYYNLKKECDLQKQKLQQIKKILEDNFNS